MINEKQIEEQVKQLVHNIELSVSECVKIKSEDKRLEQVKNDVSQSLQILKQVFGNGNTNSK